MEHDWFDQIADDDYWAQSSQVAFQFEEDALAFSTNVVPRTRQSVTPQTSVDIPNAAEDKAASRKASIGTSSASRAEPAVVSNALIIPLGSEDIKAFVSRLNSHNLRKSRHGKVEGTPASTAEIIKRIIKGEDQYCYYLKSREDKVLLLDKCIEHNDGNAIMTAVLFLERTLSLKVFNYEISKRPKAIDHFTCYLRDSKKTSQLVDFLTMLGKYEDAAMVKLKQANAASNTEAKIKNLRNCNLNYFAGFVGSGFGETFAFWSGLIDEQVALLERQLPIEAEDKRIESQPITELTAKFIEVPRKSLLNKPVITTLFYCCLYHYELPENFLASPLAIRNVHRLTEKQFMWTALVSLSMRQKWKEVDNLFQGTSWLGGKRFKTALKFEEVTRILKKFDAPNDLLTKYIKLIDDDDAKLAFAKETNLIPLFVEFCITARNRQELHDILPRLESNLKMQNAVREALRSPVKWKN